MNESAFNSWLRDRLPGMSVRIENAIGSGLPDIALFYEGQTYWIESKVGKNPLLRPYQFTMHLRMWSHGGVNVLIFLLDGDTMRVYRAPYKAHMHQKYYLIDSDPVWCGHKSALSTVEICGILKKVAMV